LVAELEAEIARVGAERVIAFVAEPVVGATLGAVPPVPGYFRGIREVCDRHGILLILDEVMCGIGRTGTLFACEQEQVRADIVTIGKGLAAGYQPLAAFISSRAIHDAIQAGSGYFQHGLTRIPGMLPPAPPGWPSRRLSRAAACLRGLSRPALCWSAACAIDSETIRTSATSVVGACSGAWSWSATARRRHLSILT